MFINSILYPKSHAFNPTIVPLISPFRRPAAPQDGTLSRQELRRIVADMVD